MPIFPIIVIVVGHRGPGRRAEPHNFSLLSLLISAVREFMNHLAPHRHRRGPPRLGSGPHLAFVLWGAGKAPTFTSVRKSSGESRLNLHSFLCRFFCVKIESCISRDNHR